MPIPLLIGSCEPFSGKSAVVLGLARQLGREGVSVLFGKPLATSAADFPMDPEVRFVGTTLGLPDEQLLPSLRVLEPATAQARLLAADLARMRPGEAGGAWDTAARDEELRKLAQRKGEAEPAEADGWTGTPPQG